MKKNEVFTASCTSMTDQGFGVVHYEGLPVFVSNLLEGEKAEIRIVKTFKKYAIGKVEKRLSDSPWRVKPQCSLAARCGGCALQHIQYEHQLEMKEEQLRHLFKSVAPEMEILPVLGMENPWHYRNKAQFPIQVHNGKVEAGFYRPRTNNIQDMDSCMIQSELINEIFSWIKSHISIEQAQSLRHLFIRTSFTTGQAQVVFIGKKDHGLKELAKELHEAFPQIESILFNKNERDDNVILGEDWKVLFGKEWIEESCLGLKIQLHFKSFFQVNPVQMEVLYQTALDFADLKDSDEVIELYSGTGTIGLLAAQKAKHVTGVEIVEEAVANARENARMNGIENAEFVCQDATEFARENTKKADVVFVDPPRKGMSEQGIKDIAMLNPEKVVYISCNPRTLARDLKVFLTYGYQPEKLQPVDMFSQTPHVESVCLLSRRENEM